MGDFQRTATDSGVQFHSARESYVAAASRVDVLRRGERQVSGHIFDTAGRP